PNNLSDHANSSTATLEPSVAAASAVPGNALAPSRAALQLACIILGYIGVYLCRKNFSVAVPSLQTAFATDKAHIGAIDSYATIAYVLGKLFWGPNIVDRFGGRICFFVI